MNREDLYDIVREMLTDYNANFVGEPCSEIVQEVVECIDDGIADDEVCDAIQYVISNMFD